MSIHIEAEDGAIAETVLLPGDPLRATFVAEEYLEEVTQYNAVRGMNGYTGLYKGVPVSVQGTGMGMPSLAIYVQELISYGAKRLIRIGSCGAMQPELSLRSLIVALTASTDSAMNRLRFHGMEYAPTVSWSLLRRTIDVIEARGIPYTAGGILSSDTFYNDDPDLWKIWANHGILAVEMETNQLYTIAARHGADALSLLTVSDSLVTKEELNAEARQRSFHEMVETALEVGITAMGR